MARSILIVDDDESVRRAIARNLRARGFEVSTTASVGEALTVLDGHDVVILDLVLGDAPGTVVLRNIRRQCRPPRVAVL